MLHGIAYIKVRQEIPRATRRNALEGSEGGGRVERK